MGVTSRKTGTYVNLKIKDQAFPEFQIQKKEGDEWVVAETGDEFTGLFRNAKITEYEYQKKTRNKLEMEFDDPDSREKLFLSVNFNSLALNIINTLANEETLVGREIKLSVYSKKDNEGTSRPRIFIEIDGEKGSWKFGTDVIGQIYKHQEKWVDMFDKYIKKAIEGFIPNEEDGEDFPSIEEVSGDTDKTNVAAGAEEPLEEEFDDLPF